MSKKLLLTFICLLLVAGGCKKRSADTEYSEEDEGDESNVLIDYVSEPKDEAREVRQAVEKLEAERQLAEFE